MRIIKSKMFKILSFLVLFGILLGIILYFIIDKNDKSTIETTLIKYINNIDTNKFNYGNSLFNTILNNIKIISIVWLFGIIFILSIFIPIILIYKGIILGFSIISIISTFTIKGILYGLIIVFPCSIISILILITMSYYSINFSRKCYKAIKNNKLVNLKDFIKNYSLIYLILCFSLIINSIIEVYFVSNVIKFVV